MFTILGAVAFLILTAMAITSNNASARILGRNWKRLHYLIYVALILIIIHSFNIGQIFLESTIIKIIVGALIVLLIIVKIKKV